MLYNTSRARAGKSCAIGLCSLLALALGGCSGIEQLNPMRSEERREILESAPGPEVESVEAVLRKSAVFSEKSGNFPKAAESYGRLAEMTNAAADKVAQAENLRRSGKTADAVRIFDEVLEEEPENVDALEGKALALLSRGSFEQANTYLKQVLATDEPRWRTLNAAGVSFALQGEYRDAIEYFKAALEVEPKNTTVLNNVGLVLALRQDYENAAQYLERASLLTPWHGERRGRIDLNTSLVFGLMGDIENAEKYAKPYLNEAELYNNLGLYASLQEDEALAKSYLNMALTNSPVYYDKAWRNLEHVGKRRGEAARSPESSSPPSPAKAPLPVAPQMKPVREPDVAKPDTSDEKSPAAVSE